MLSLIERERIDKAATQAPDRRSVVCDALMVVQEARGWVSDQALAEVAEALGMSRDEVEGVATFFELVFRRSVGKHVILICDSVSCWIKGYEALLSQLRARLGIGPGETTSDGMFNLLPAGCLGACDKAPAMMVDEELFVGVDEAALDRILEGFRDGGHGNAAHR
ncbi:MAG TPA: NADH-quinone oxidoreductase subunit NuoE [Rectinemataceae bacterium]|nr:NADH-quinone oxidoreductase subunit NuoE [Rectinemataceae bacterium]